MPPFAIQFKPSKLRKIILALLCLTTLYISLSYFSGSPRLLLSVLTIAIGIYAWQEHPFIKRLEINPKHRVTLHIKDTTHPAELLSGSLISQHICLLRWKIDKHIIHQIILPDSTDKPSAKKLKLWARFSK